MNKSRYFTIPAQTNTLNYGKKKNPSKAFIVCLDGFFFVIFDSLFLRQWHNLFRYDPFLFALFSTFGIFDRDGRSPRLEGLKRLFLAYLFGIGLEVYRPEGIFRFKEEIINYSLFDRAVYVIVGAVGLDRFALFKIDGRNEFDQGREIVPFVRSNGAEARRIQLHKIFVGRRLLTHIEGGRLHLARQSDRKGVSIGAATIAYRLGFGLVAATDDPG